MTDHIDARDYGCTTSGDNVAAWLACMDAAAANKVRRVFWPEGDFHFSAPPAPIAGIEMYGVNMGYTRFIRDFSIANTPFLKINGGSSGLKDLSLIAGDGSSLGNALMLYADSTQHSDGRDVCPDYSVIEDVTITRDGGGTWNWPIVIDGSLRSIGARDLQFRNVFVFAGVLGGLWINKGIKVILIGGGLFPAGGQTPGGNMYVVGGCTLISRYGFQVSGSITGSDAGVVTSYP